MKAILIILSAAAILFTTQLSIAVQIAPRITDREIVECLTKLEEGQGAINKRIDGLDENINSRIDDLNKNINRRIDDLRAAMNRGFDNLQWMLGLFITIFLVILGFVLRMQWNMQKRLTSVETTVDAHEKTLVFLKNLIEKFLPPSSVL